MKIFTNFLFANALALLLVTNHLFADDTNSRLDEISKKILLLEQKIKERRKLTNQKLSPYRNNADPSFDAPPIVPKPTDTPSLKEEPLEPAFKSNSFTELEETPEESDWYESKDFDYPQNPLNHLSFSLGLVIPGDSSTSKGVDLSFDSGIDIGFEYSRYFSDNSYIGAGFTYKSFDGKGNLPNPISHLTYEADSSLFALFGTLGQNWSLSNSLSLLTQASAGFVNSDYEFNFHSSKPGGTIIPTQKESDTSFYYSLLLGLNIQWTQIWHSTLFYELDGRSEAGNLDNQNFHHIGLKTGFGF